MRLYWRPKTLLINRPFFNLVYWLYNSIWWCNKWFIWPWKNISTIQLNRTKDFRTKAVLNLAVTVVCEVSSFCGSTCSSVLNDRAYFENLQGWQEFWNILNVLISKPATCPPKKSILFLVNDLLLVCPTFKKIPPSYICRCEKMDF